MKRSCWKFLLAYLAAAAAFCLLLLCFSHLMTPGASDVTTTYRAEEIAQAAAARDVSFDPKQPLLIHQPVNYDEQSTAPWRPKGESPLLAELVKEGKLPPVAERVGPEPCVMKGVDGVGNYGGTWIRLANRPGDVGVIQNRLSCPTLVRWSPLGYPVVPHVAKSYEVLDGGRTFVFHLRKGMRWSDGHPFTADDIMFWWEHECNDANVLGTPPSIMMVRGKYGTVEKINDYAVKFSFPVPHGYFLIKIPVELMLATQRPAHYLRQFHPTVGDKKVLDEYMKRRNLPNANAVYRDVVLYNNPDLPRLWPWVYRNYRASPPQSYVRNPYYFVVDPAGNQLPYIDRVMFEVKKAELLSVSAAQGGATMQARWIRYEQYTHFMSQREKGGFDVYHWYPGDRSAYAISPNLNRRVDDDKPETKHLYQLLNDKRFRQALSLAIDRRAIIEAEYNGQTEPAQVAPGPSSFFYEPTLYKAFTEHDPERANRLLDEIGLTQRDYEGFRTFPDGSRMTFFFYFCAFTGEGPGQFVVDDWAKVGVRAVLRERSRPLFYSEKRALVHDFNVWSGNDEFFPLIEPRYFLPVRIESNFALGYGRWFERGGLYGDPKAARKFGCIEPPRGHLLRQAMEIYERAGAEVDPEKQRDIFREVLLIAADNLWTINVSTPPPTLAIVKQGLRNVPRKAVYSWDFQSPSNCGMETFYFEEPRDSPGALEQIKNEALEVVAPMPGASASAEGGGGAGESLAWLLRVFFLSIAALLILLVAVKHPYVGRRLLIMIPTLCVVSILAFIVIQLPPGSFVETKIMELEESGDVADMRQIEDLKEMFYLEESMLMRYVRWLGLRWFTSFEIKERRLVFNAADKGLLQGYMGRSMETQRPVREDVGDRILLTLLIALGTIVFTWSIAIPIGIYSAVRQYSLGDYALTFIGFIGMCVPGFLLALLLMYAGAEWLGLKVSGLFSSQYGAQPEWDWPKIRDLLQHIWVPIVVLGVGGTAQMIRVMRANLLDELKKPYVVTARAKGVRPVKLLFKYPVRLALNPFISGIGGLFPQLVSGGAIVAIVLSLPTIGPLLLEGLMTEDMYLAGSLLMVLSVLGVVGTLVSDLLLLWVDPRIRFKGGAR